jgi:RNA polymerase sigma-70 factor (ECF subfamily)
MALDDATRPPLAPGPRPASDEATAGLLERASRGDRDAWGSLIARYDGRVVALLVARGVRIDRARELAQDAWARLLEKSRAGALGELKLPGLVFQQAIFLATDAARRGRWEVRLSHGDGEVPDARDPAPGAEEVLLSRAALAAARASFEECSPAEQRIFRALYERPEATCRMVAEALGVSEQRVKQVAYEVRKRLRAALEEKT